MVVWGSFASSGVGPNNEEGLGVLPVMEGHPQLTDVNPIEHLSHAVTSQEACQIETVKSR